MPVTRSIVLADLTPEELAELFCEKCGDEQARFFDHINVIARSWPGSGWCGQAHDIAQNLGTGGRSVVKTLAGHTV